MSSIRPEIDALPGSRIREVANAALGRSDVLAFWFGESDEPTPREVCEAATESLARGETFYAHNLGLPSLREALAAYSGGLHGALGADRIAVTASGVTALMLAMQMLAGPGDEVVAVTPVWPNLTAQPVVQGARVTRLPLQPHAGRWLLDMDRLRATVTPRTRVLLVNSPNNPTGWTLGSAEQQQILEHCRATGTWILADEVYERLFLDGASAAAPSFLDIASPRDRVVVVNSFSKSFLMTGWRLGWLVLPEGLQEAMGKLIEFTSSCSPVFVQRGGEAALRIADSFVPALRQRMVGCRDRLVTGLRGLPGVQVEPAPGGMYAFFRIEGHADSFALARALVADHGLGLAPGVAFGPEGEGWLRWCFASRDPARLDEGVRRLARALGGAAAPG
jgi:aspartate/methionine/tyrosine aminotransferase